MIGESTGTPKTIVQHILQDDLKKKKAAPTLCITRLNKWTTTRASHIEDLLEMIENDPDFVDSIITGDESWCFAYNSLTKWQSVAWVGLKSSYVK